jgi:hypothetical protein
MAGRAQPIATVGHLHISDRPLVMVPLTLAGEANAPLAALVGRDPTDPTLLVVPQPRDRDLRFAFAAGLADVVLAYVDSCCANWEQGRDRQWYTQAPQLLVPNPSGLAFLRLFGRSTRFRRTVGPYAVPMKVPQLGQWLTYFADRSQHPGASAALAMTEALAMHWATGQSALEDTNLATLLAWIQPPPGQTGAQAAQRAEDPSRWPPAGPSTDPGFDTAALAPAIAAYDRSAPESAARDAALAALRHVLLGQLRPTWGLMWQGVELLRSLPPGGSVTDRWREDRQSFTAFHEHVSGGGLPQAKRDSATAAAVRLNRMERAQTRYDAARAFDDPLVMAAHRLTGAAFDGTVVEVDRTRRVPNPRGNLVTRPLLTVLTKDPVHLAAGTTVVAVSRRQQTGTITSTATEAGKTVVVLELAGGMGRSKLPPPGSVPEPGESLCYTSVLGDDVPAPGMPSAEDTPWTHGGPREPYLPTDEDAGERWA